MSSWLANVSLIIPLILVPVMVNVGVVFGSSQQVQYLNQGFDEETRQVFYHAPQGTRLLPYSWFLALEQATYSEKFLEDDNLRRLGIIPDHNLRKNPDQLPVGFAKTIDITDQEAWVGLTCAACHTSEMTYNNHRIRIDGGPSLFDAMAFAADIGNALGSIVGEHADEGKLTRFSKLVLNEQWSQASQEQLQAKVLSNLKEMLEPQRVAKEKEMSLYPTAWGSGRLDALGRGGNTVLLQLDRSNLRPANAAVSFPAVWNTWRLDRVQWNGAVLQPMGRNLLQALGLNANLIFDSNDKQFRTSTSVKDLSRIEKLIQHLASPMWPGELFGAIDQAKASRGEKLYEQHCAHCHVPKLTAPNKYGQQFKHVILIPLEEIGTDPLSATNFHNRTVKSGPLGLGLLTVADTAQYLTTHILEGQYKELDISEEQQNAWNGGRRNTIQAPLAYIARPHSGVWALAPYLHNGSVPNLYQLLSPREERENVFYVGPTEFDPKNVGFISQKTIDTDFEFDTSIPGNSNAGHEFRPGSRQNGVIGPALSKAERWDLIEYLKTL